MSNKQDMCFTSKFQGLDLGLWKLMAGGAECLMTVQIYTLRACKDVSDLTVLNSKVSQ